MKKLTLQLTIIRPKEEGSAKDIIDLFAKLG